MDITSMGFSILNNVEIQVIDKENKKIIKTVKTHNKATRNMVTGILRFIKGLFTSTTFNDDIMYDGTVSKFYIPCCFNVGDGGVILDDNGKPKSLDENDDILRKVPELDPSWTETVDYSSKNLVREFDFSGKRDKIRKQLDTLDDTPVADMDSLYFLCEVQPGQINPKYGNERVFVTEVGLFSGEIPNKGDLLAYIKLGNYDDNGTTKTNALYVRPGDTIVIKWVITIAAIGKDNILKATIKDEQNEPIVNDIVEIPDIAPIEIVDY